VSKFVTVSFLSFLETQLAEQTGMAKRERTRERLRIATLQVLNERGYEDMRTLTITEKAGLSEGLFYVYFKSKVDITLDLLEEFYTKFVQLDIAGKSQPGPFAVIQAANRHWLKVAAANPGLMRCIFQAGNEVPEFAALISQVNKAWYSRAFNAVERHRPGVQKAALMLPLYMLGGMMDELARKLVVYPDPELLAVIKSNGSDSDAVADAATMIWYRVLYLDDNIPADVSDLAQQLVGHI
jgi:TetR/AcrR family transcriptional regulator, transcriptional repressor for nem operon